MPEAQLTPSSTSDERKFRVADEAVFNEALAKHTGMLFVAIVGNYDTDNAHTMLAGYIGDTVAFQRKSSEHVHIPTTGKVSDYTIQSVQMDNQHGISGTYWKAKGVAMDLRDDHVIALHADTIYDVSLNRLAPAFNFFSPTEHSTTVLIGRNAVESWVFTNRALPMNPSHTQSPTDEETMSTFRYYADAELAYWRRHGNDAEAELAGAAAD